ncbi:carboxylesterase [Cadophora sp. MPI-SDFR-AT-0126]|nr:carboxylesterase [Leotiomycetes sp. MPI-SDFR-AT-0126]
MGYTQSWQELEKASGGRVVLHGSVQNIRDMDASSAALCASLLPPPSDATTSVDGEVEGIKYRIYTPRDASKLGGPLPVAIWTHGGGWVTGNLDSDDLLCRIVAERAPAIVVNVDYRLAPEHPYPTPLEDTLKVYRWAQQNATSLGGDAKRFFTIGGSAGGGLALQVANRLVKDPMTRNNIKGVAAMVPCTLHFDNVPSEYQYMHKSYEENKTDVPVINKESMEIFYREAQVDPEDSNTFTALATDNHENFPPTYFASCEFDPLRDDAYVMEAALKSKGVPTKHNHYKGMPHYFWVFPLPEREQFIDDLVEGVRWLISQM